MSGQSAQQIKALLEQKRDLLCEMAEVTDKQNALFAQDDLEPLLHSIDERQRIIDSIDELDAQMLELAGGMTQGDDAQRKAYIKNLFPALWEDVMQVLSGIVEQDGQNSQRAQEVIDDFRARIRQSAETRTAVDGYFSEGGAQGAFFDEKN